MYAIFLHTVALFTYCSYILMLASLTLGSVITAVVDSGKDACWINFERNLLLSVVYVALRPIRTNLKEEILSKTKFYLYL